MTAPRTARTHVLVAEQFDGRILAHPVTAPDLAAYDREEDALAELSLYLRERFARAEPQAIARLSLPDEATLLEVSVTLPRDDLPRKLQSDVAVTFVCVVVPASSHGDVWVLVPALDHAFWAEAGEPLEEAARAEIRRLVAAQDLSPWEQLGLLPPRAARLLSLEVPLPDPEAGAEGTHLRLAERARRRRAEDVLRAVSTRLHDERPPPLVGRDAEMGLLRSLLDGRDRLGVLLVGPEHAGKSALVRAYAATPGARPVHATSGAQLVAGMSGLGQWQERVRDVMDAVERLDAVLYFESLDDLLAERVESGGLDLPGAMRPWLDEGKVRIVGEIPGARLDGLEGRHWAFFAALSRLRVEPLTPAATRLVLEARAAHDARAEPDRPRVAPEAFETLVDLCERYLPYGAFPGKAVRLYEDLRAAHEQGHAGATEPPVLGRLELYQAFSLATGVPELLLRDDTPLRIEDLSASLRRHVIGQEDAIRRLCETIGVVKAGLQPSGKPLSTFLFIGPTGVGKTELARALAALLFGSADRLTRFDMSEFMTPDAAERLIRGTDSESGLLTRRVREQPFCVLLLDEIEKAHPAVFDLLLQVCGEGRLTDALGQTAYFHNAILIMTSNLGAADRRTPAGFGAGTAADPAHYERLVSASFRQEFVGRIDRIVPFRALSRAEIREVARLGKDRLGKRSGLDEAGCTLAVSDAALARFADEGYSETFGARALRRHLDEHLAAPLGRLLSALGGDAKDLTIDVTLADEPGPPREGVVATTAEAGGFRFEARRHKRAREARETSDHARIAAHRRAVDRHMDLAPVGQLEDQIDFLVTQLNLSDKELRDRRLARDFAELSSEHHRLSELWQKLLTAQEELHAAEELAIVALLEGQPVGPMVGEAEKAARAFAHALPYALLAQEPRRDAITLMIEELDPGALHPWLAPLLRELDRRAWSALAHVEGGERLPDEVWPAERRWGPPRTAAWLRGALSASPEGAFRNVLLRVKGPYAGVLLALEAGLCRRVVARKGEDKDDDGRLHVGVRTVALSFDVPEDAWTTKHLAAPPPASAPARRRGPAARELDETTGQITVHRQAVVKVDPAQHWERLEEVALAQLLLFESGALDRDEVLATPSEPQA